MIATHLLNTTYLNQRNNKMDVHYQVDGINLASINLWGPDKHITRAMANAIRRIIIQELPIWAPDQVTILNNTTAYHNDVLQQRIHLLSVNQQMLEKHDPRQLSFSLSVTLPAESTAPGYYKIYLYDHLTSLQENISPQELQQLFPYNSLICTMRPGESLDLNFTLSQGYGYQNSKWTAGFCTYQPFTTEEDQLVYQLAIESYGKWPAMELFRRAQTIIHDRLQDFAQFIVSTAPRELPNKVKVWTLPRQDDTIGNLYQALMMVQPEVSNNLTQAIVAYKIPHPLKEETEIWCRLPTGQESDIINQTITAYLRQWSAQSSLVV